MVASRRVLVPAARAPSPPRIPVAGAGDGFEWTQSDAELTISVPVPAGTGKNEVLLQMTPRFGPARQLVLRARFWPRPLVAGELHAEVEASESMWHLDEKGDHVVIDLPKISEALWPAPFAPLPALAAAAAGRHRDGRRGGGRRRRAAHRGGRARRAAARATTSARSASRAWCS